MSARCSRIWEVEAARDGRLRGAALDAHHQHLATCSSCRGETRALAEIAERCKAVDDGPVDEIAMRRMRRDVLERADGVLSGRSRPASRARIKLFALALVASAFVVVATWWGRTRVSQPPPVVVEATAGPSAHWQRTAEPEVERFRLEDGVLSLHVRREPGSRRVVVEVPDGEIEDIGTVFRVEVSHARTDRVAVEEGMVHVRLRDGLDVTLHSGEQWARTVVVGSTAVEAPRASPAAGAPPSSALPRHVEPAPIVAAPSRTSASTDVNAQPAESAPPNDPANAEDDAYLHVLALLHERRTGDARSAAQDYLARFPQGFRRKEMSRVAAGQEP